MSYEIGRGIPESGLPVWQDELRSQYGMRSDGGINFKRAPLVPVVLCSVQLKDKLLLVKRNPELSNAGGKWSFVSGYVDQPKSVTWHAQHELWHELKIALPQYDFQRRDSYLLKNSQQPRSHVVWLRHVVLYELPEMQPDGSEIVDTTWAHPDKLPSHDILDDLPYAAAVGLGMVVPGQPFKR